MASINLRSIFGRREVRNITLKLPESDLFPFPAHILISRSQRHPDWPLGIAGSSHDLAESRKSGAGLRSTAVPSGTDGAALTVAQSMPEGTKKRAVGVALSLSERTPFIQAELQQPIRRYNASRILRPVLNVWKLHPDSQKQDKNMNLLVYSHVSKHDFNVLSRPGQLSMHMNSTDVRGYPRENISLPTSAHPGNSGGSEKPTVRRPYTRNNGVIGSERSENEPYDSPIMASAPRMLRHILALNSSLTPFSLVDG